MSETNDWFSDHTENIKSRSVRGGSLMILSQACTIGIRLVTATLLARLLLPEDFGKIAMVMAIISVAHVFQDMGLSMATIQRERINNQQVSTLFWIAVGAGFLLMAVCWIAAPAIAQFYSAEALIDITLALAVTFPLSGLSIQHMALLKRKMDFTAITKIQILPILIANIAAVAIAFTTQSYWALAFQIVATESVKLLLSWKYCDWRPGKPHWNQSIREMINFGGLMTAFSLLGYLATNLHLILIGRFWNAMSIGYYTRAQFLQGLMAKGTSEPITTVAVSALSRLQDKPHAFRNYYLKALSYSLVAAAPMCIFSSYYADDIVRILLGPDWGPTATIFQIMAVALLIQPVSHSSGWIYIAQGDSRGMMVWGCIGWSVSIAGGLIGLQFGLNGVAYGYTIGLYLIAIPCMKMAFRNTELRLRDVTPIVAKPSAIAIVALAMPVYFVPQNLSVVPAFILSGTLYAIAYVVGLLLLPSQRALMIDGFNQLRRRTSASS